MNCLSMKQELHFTESFEMQAQSGNHPSVHKIRQTFMTDEKISFKIVAEDIVRKKVMNLDGSKTTPNGDVSVNILKSAIDIHLPCITNIINL